MRIFFPVPRLFVSVFMVSVEPSLKFSEHLSFISASPPLPYSPPAGFRSRAAFPFSPSLPAVAGPEAETIRLLSFVSVTSCYVSAFFSFAVIFFFSYLPPLTLRSCFFLCICSVFCVLCRPFFTPFTCSVVFSLVLCRSLSSFTFFLSMPTRLFLTHPPFLFFLQTLGSTVPSHIAAPCSRRNLWFPSSFLISLLSLSSVATAFSVSVFFPT